MANENARRLRKSLTPQEVKLWVRLRSLKEGGFHIRRQAPIGPYIVDFVCFSRKIIIEADGGQHGLSQHKEQDRIRDAFLRSQGYRIMRFWNSDIDANLDGVMTIIATALRSPHPDRLAPSTLPTRGRDKAFRAIRLQPDYSPSTCSASPIQRRTLS